MSNVSLDKIEEIETSLEQAKVKLEPPTTINFKKQKLPTVSLSNGCKVIDDNARIVDNCDNDEITYKDFSTEYKYFKVGSVLKYFSLTGEVIAKYLGFNKAGQILVEFGNKTLELVSSNHCLVC